MEIREEQIGDVSLVELSGRLTVDEKEGLIKDTISNAMARGAKHVLLHLAGVRYIDSTRLGELIAAHIAVTRRGGKLKLVATPDRIVELLALAGLDGVFERFNTAEEARKALES